MCLLKKIIILKSVQIDSPVFPLPPLLDLVMRHTVSCIATLRVGAYWSVLADWFISIHSKYKAHLRALTQAPHLEETFSHSVAQKLLCKSSQLLKVFFSASQTKRSVCSHPNLNNCKSDCCIWSWNSVI